MAPCRLKFLTYQPQPQEPCTEGVFFICRLRPCESRAFLRQGLIADGEAQLYVGFDFSGMGRAVKQTEFNCPFLEDSMKIQTFVAAVMIMIPAAIVPVVPKLF